MYAQNGVKIALQDGLVEFGGAQREKFVNGAVFLRVHILFHSPIGNVKKLAAIAVNGDVSTGNELGDSFVEISQGVLHLTVHPLPGKDFHEGFGGGIMSFSGVCGEN